MLQKRARGDLRIKFKIIFPELSDRQRADMAEILRGTTTRK